ncbi:restriction endonuclease PLD domain-containing protein [uncultured Flavobacterium sp.]|uniref:restriction endonuclease PLD domain-containing protein n=1 Tax=uncultured Flavobacterium sp. TaxID=165435 RepID=UPI00261B7B93|nr:restriction endonuclease PLD domain-containing protein [uncultured Flavobacterium sp.]
MSLLILLRKSASVNRFHNLLINSIDSGEGDSALLCSGFFQEMNNYSASLDSGLCSSLFNNNVSLTTIGVHNRMWLNRYRSFRDILISNGNTVNALITNNFHWHAKIFILKKQGEPIFGIIGSSNMTRNAFGHTAPFNFEADVVLWDSSNNAINNICQSQTEISGGDFDDIIYADYNVERNRGKNSMEKLKDLENEIMSKTQLDELQ